MTNNVCSLLMRVTNRLIDLHTGEPRSSPYHSTGVLEYGIG